ncbi:MAG TPA: Uma2 family endonuclease [Pirellulales bacterium]|nr:Uma2 family endonuclease [Pirellulales bacterium]
MSTLERSPVPTELQLPSAAPYSAAPPTRVSVVEYLAAELDGQRKHEYVEGAVYMMSGARILHNVIAGNLFASLHARLRGKPCQVFHSDMKVHIVLPGGVRFYYPDAQVVCRSNAPHETFQDEPRVIVEVLSRSTRRIDEGEKKDAYLMIPSLAVYLLVEQETPAIVALRRTEQGFVREVYAGAGAVVPLKEIEAELPLAEVYERVEFSPEPDDAAQ